MASQALECAHAVTAVDFAPITLSDKRYPVVVQVLLEGSCDITAWSCDITPVVM